MSDNCNECEECARAISDLADVLRVTIRVQQTMTYGEDIYRPDHVVMACVEIMQSIFEAVTPEFRMELETHISAELFSIPEGVKSS